MKNKVSNILLHNTFLILSSSVILLSVLLFTVFKGNADNTTAEFFKAFFGKGGNDALKVILYRVRLPRAFAAVFCGGGLAVSGYLLQCTLNNALASPGILGINHGAGFFVLLSGILFPFSKGFIQLFAFAGAVISALAVYFISYKAGVSKTTLILSGVAISSLYTAMSNTLITLKPDAVTDKNAFNLGGLSGSMGKEVFPCAVTIFIFMLLVLFFSKGIELFALGDEVAGELGLNIRRYRFFILICAAALAGAAVSVCGAISFVGLLVPNLLRLFNGLKVRSGIIMSFLCGGILLLFCDFLSRTLFYPYEVPSGLFLSFLGAPFFIYVLIKRKRKLSVN